MKKKETNAGEDEELHKGKFQSKPLFLIHFLLSVGRKQNTLKWWVWGENKWALPKSHPLTK